MKPLLNVAFFTIKDMIKRKSFIISNIIILLIIFIGFNIPNLLKTVGGEDFFSEDSMLIVDNENVFEGRLTQLENQSNNMFEIITNEASISYESIKGKVDSGEYESAVIISKNDEEINIEYIVKSTIMENTLPEQITSFLPAIYKELQISKLNLEEDVLKMLNPVFMFELTQTEETEITGNVFVMMMLSIVLFYAIYFCAYQVSSSITTEKTSRIIETLVTSTKPKIIVLGKTIGVGILGLLQIIVIVAFALFCANIFLEKELVMSAIDLSKFTPLLAFITILYFILGYSFYALCYALTGSTVSKPEDIQSANGPVAILAVIGFYLSYFTMLNPTSKINSFASIFPLSAPFSMPFRIMLGVATTSEVLISIIILIVSIILIANISIKIYSQAILNYGTKLSLKTLFSMYKQKW